MIIEAEPDARTRLGAGLDRAQFQPTQRLYRRVYGGDIIRSKPQEEVAAGGGASLAGVLCTSSSQRLQEAGARRPRHNPHVALQSVVGQSHQPEAVHALAPKHGSQPGDAPALQTQGGRNDNGAG